MDRLTQLQDAIEALLTITTNTLFYLTTKTALKRLNSDVPVTWRREQGEVSEAVFEANKQEQVEDLTRKAKQVEYLIKALPEKEDAERSNMRLQGIEAEMKVANEEYREAVKVAEILLAEINLTIKALLDGGGSGEGRMIVDRETEPGRGLIAGRSGIGGHG